MIWITINLFDAQGLANEAMQRMTIEATSKENYYSKQCVTYFQSWHMGTTNKLLQTALQKLTHRSRQPEASVVTYCHTVGENGLGLNRPWRRRCTMTCWHMNKYSMKIVMMTNFGALNKFVDFSAAYTQVRLYGCLLVLKPGVAYTRVYTVSIILHSYTYSH